MANWTNNNPTYYINPAHLTFVENSGYGPNFIQVSASSSCYISVYDPANGINFSDADKNYCRWKVTAYNNKFPDTESAHRGKWGIYVRCERQGSSALVVYDQVERGVHGGVIVEKTDEQGNVTKVEGEYDKENHPYYFIRIGEVGPTNGTTIREISYDTGYLESKQGEQDSNSINDMWELDKYSTPWLIKAKQWLKDFTVKGFITLMGGLKFKMGEQEKPLTDVAVSNDKESEELVSDTTIATTAWVQSTSNDRFLRKDKDDRSKGGIASDKGIEVGDFVLGMDAGSGAKLFIEATGKTYLEADRAHFREELVVPKITFNCIDVVSGEKVQTFAYGTIKDVWPNNDGTGIATLDLLEGEYGTLQVKDILRGVFHRLEGGNETEYKEDDNRFYNYAGFSTSYFTPVEILDNRPGYMRFYYELQPGKSVHPCAGMNFYAYGNFEDENRQSITYENRDYTRRICGVNNWEVVPDKHVKYQDGLLDGLTIGGMTMKGRGTFGENFYITGSTFDFTPQQKEELKGESAYSVSLSEYVGTIRVNEKGEIEADSYRTANVVADEENVIAVDENVVATDYLLRTRIQAYKGSQELVYSEYPEKGVYTANISPTGCEASLKDGVIFIERITGASECFVTVNVNCEQYAPFVLSYDINVQKDGHASFKSIVFTRANEEPVRPSGGSYASPLPEDKNNDGGLIWSDGVPVGTAKVWVSSRVFTSDGKEPQQDEWSNPSPLTDTSDFEVIYSPLKEHKDIPSEFKKNGVEIDDEWLAVANANGWYDDATEESVWMATNTCHNGAWQGWKISKIKGEKGEDGVGAYILSVSASAVSRNSIGTYEPSSVLVDSYRGKNAEEVYLTVYGKNSAGEYRSISNDGWHEEKGTSWVIDLTAVSLADYKALVFRVYENVRVTSYDAPYLSEATVTFIGDGAAGPMPRNRGKFVSGKAYCYNDNFRDFVWHPNGQVYMREIKYATSAGQDKGYVATPSVEDSDYWVQTGREALMAIDTALIDGANIAGFGFKNGVMASLEGQDSAEFDPDKSKLILDGKNGWLKCVDADVDGDIKVGSMAYKVLYADGGTYNLSGVGMVIGWGRFELPSMDRLYSTEIKLFFENWSRVPRSCVIASDDIPIRISDNRGFGIDVNEYTLPNDNVMYTITLVYNSLTGSPYWMVGSNMGGSEGGGISLYVDSVLDEDSEYPVQNKVITNEFKKYVTLKGNKQTIEGDKDFTGQLMVNGKPLVYNSTYGYWKLDGDLLVTGGVAMHSSDTSFSPSTITQAVAVDGTTIINDGKKLMLNPNIELGGGGVNSWLELMDTPKTIAGYDIRDAKIEGKTITLGSNSMTVYAADYAGTANQVLISGGEGLIPYWVNQGSITAGALTTKNKTAWGQTYWTSNGVPTDISGSISDTGNITPQLSSTYTVGEDGNGYKCFHAQGSSTDVGLIATGRDYKLGFIIGTGNSNRGIFDFTNNSWLMYRGDSNNIYFPQGHIGIGTPNPESKLHVNGSVQAENTFWLSTKDPGNGTLGFTQGGVMILRHSTSGGTILSADNETIYFRPKGSTNGDAQCTISAGGNMLVSGGVSMHSDERKKTILNHVELSLEEVANAPLIEYYYKSDEQRTTHVGSIAQYWAGLNDWFCKKDEDGFYAMEIQNAALASAISVARDFMKYKEAMAKEIRLMKEEIENLKRKWYGSV